MAHSTWRRRALAVAVTGVLSLSGCAGGAGPEPVASTSGPPAVQPVSFDTATAATPGNAVLPFGAPARVTSDDGAASALISVLKIEAGDASVFDDWANGDEFDGKTPYFVVVQTTLLSGTADAFAIFPTNESGAAVEYVVNVVDATEAAAGTTECPLELAVPEDDATQLTCIIGLADEGEQVVGGMYTGDLYNAFTVNSTGASGMYANAPVRWSADALAEIAFDATAIDMSAGGEATAPGTTVPLGQAAWLPLPGKPETVVGTSVLKIVPGDASFFDRYGNAADFAGTTPTYVVVQFDYPDAATAQAGEFPALFPVLADGTNGSWMPAAGGVNVTGAPGNDMCPLVLPVNDPASATRVECIVTLGTGQAVTAMRYIGEAYGALFADDALGYYSAPVLFQ